MARERSAAELEQRARRMTEEGFKIRDYALRDICSLATEITVDQCGAVFAGVVLWH